MVIPARRRMSSSVRRYKGSGANEFQAKVKNVEVVDGTVRFHLHAPWPDFMTYYGSSATAAGLVVPKKYLEQVGEEGFKKHPIGLGPYKFVSHTPGVELVLEAFEGYWRKVPNIKRLTIKSVPEESTRLAMMKKGEADFAAAMQGEIAEDVKRDPSWLWLIHACVHILARASSSGSQNPLGPISAYVWLLITPSIGRRSMSVVPRVLSGRPVIVPRDGLRLQTELIPYDPQKAKQLRPRSAIAMALMRATDTQPGISDGRRSGGQLPECRGYSGAPAHHGARHISHLLARQKAAGVLLAAVGASQCRHARRGFYVLSGLICLRWLSRSRRTLRTTGG